MPFHADGACNGRLELLWPGLPIGRIAAWVKACADCHEAETAYEHLSRLSDAELKRRGLSRDIFARDLSEWRESPPASVSRLSLWSTKVSNWHTCTGPTHSGLTVEIGAKADDLFPSASLLHRKRPSETASGSACQSSSQHVA